MKTDNKNLMDQNGLLMPIKVFEAVYREIYIKPRINLKDINKEIECSGTRKMVLSPQIVKKTGDSVISELYPLDHEIWSKLTGIQKDNGIVMVEYYKGNIKISASSKPNERPLLDLNPMRDHFATDKRFADITPINHDNDLIALVLRIKPDRVQKAEIQKNGKIYQINQNLFSPNTVYCLVDDCINFIDTEIKKQRNTQKQKEKNVIREV